MFQQGGGHSQENSCLCGSVNFVQAGLDREALHIVRGDCGGPEAVARPRSQKSLGGG